MQVARTSQRCIRSTSQFRQLSCCSILKTAAGSSEASSSTSETFQTKPRFFDSLSKKASPKAKHHDLKDNPSVRLTIRAPSSPAPVSYPTATRSQFQAMSARPLPPQLHKDAPAYATLQPEQIEEMRLLRLSDPTRWTRSKLAEKYNVSKYFVAMQGFGDSVEAKAIAKRVKATHEETQQATRDSWGFKKRVDREVRRRRKEFW